MDKKFVKRKINEVFGRYEYKEMLDKAATAITAQHEEENADLRRQVAVCKDELAEARDAFVQFDYDKMQAENERLRGILQALIDTIRAKDSKELPPSIVCGADLAQLALEKATDEADEPECSGQREQPQSGEQGYKRARGVLPWHEGDELPEETIARLRGRDQESEHG